MAGARLTFEERKSILKWYIKFENVAEVQRQWKRVCVCVCVHVKYSSDVLPTITLNRHLKVSSLVSFASKMRISIVNFWYLS
jgi:hypothetical protein